MGSWPFNTYNKYIHICRWHQIPISISSSKSYLMGQDRGVRHYPRLILPSALSNSQIAWIFCAAARNLANTTICCTEKDCRQIVPSMKITTERFPWDVCGLWFFLIILFCMEKTGGQRKHDLNSLHRPCGIIRWGSLMPCNVGFALSPSS